MKIVGTRIVDYVSKKTGLPVKGISLQCAGPRDGVNGMAVEQVFVSDKLPFYHEVLEYPLGSEIVCFYNRYGSVESVSLVVPAAPAEKGGK